MTHETNRSIVLTNLKGLRMGACSITDLGELPSHVIVQKPSTLLRPAHEPLQIEAAPVKPRKRKWAIWESAK